MQVFSPKSFAGFQLFERRTGVLVSSLPVVLSLEAAEAPPKASAVSEAELLQAEWTISRANWLVSVAAGSLGGGV